MPDAELPPIDLRERAKVFIEALGLKATGARFDRDHTDDVPQVIVDLSTKFLEGYALLEAYTTEMGGIVSQYDWEDAPYNLGHARFSFEGNRSLLLASGAGQCACIVRNNDTPFPFGA
jgi:hypothetical protein